MKLGIVLTTFNRSNYLAQCLDSINAAEIPEGTLIVIVDDKSTDEKTVELLRSFHPKGADVIIHYNEKNSGVSYSLKLGFNKCFFYGCDVVMNLDSDAIVKPNFIQVLTDLKNYFPQQIVSGFHSINKNKNGTDRHPIIKKSDKWVWKKSIGGINVMMNEALFRKFMEPALNRVIETKQGNWDYLTCVNCMDYDLPPAVSIPSVVQHIGFDSAMRHLEEPDVACDFDEPAGKPLSLPSVMLVAVEGVALEKIKIPWEASNKFIDFADTILLTPFDSLDYPIIKIAPMKSKQEYSKFIFKNLNYFVASEFVLLIQHDGFVVNYKAWTDEFLKYDYIGASWWYDDELVVGNGGFSLRSKKLLEVCAHDDVMTEIHPEDHAIGRIYRRYLEQHHGIKFAPKEIADRFSIEAFGLKPPANKYNGSFGFHGYSVDFKGADLAYNPLNIPRHSSNGGRGEQRRQERKLHYTGDRRKVR